MPKTTRVQAHAAHGFPVALADWIDGNGEILGSLITLRRLGSEGADAVEAVLSVRRVMTLKLSWELFDALAEGEGQDPETLLVDSLPVEELTRARLALWGPWWGDAGDSPAT